MNLSGSDQRFMRPIDVTATRRNRHRIRATKILVFLANLVLVTSLITGAYWLLRRVQEDERFAIRSIEITGIDEVRTAEVMEVLGRWTEANLFRLEMDEVRRALVSIEWIDEVAVEKQLPDRLRVEVVERIPQAVIETSGGLRYIDVEGVSFGQPSEESAARFPLIVATDRRAARRCVDFLEQLERVDPALHSRIERIRPAGSFGWEISDSDLGTTVRVGDAESAAKWRMLYGIVAAERVAGAEIKYADLRFDDQIVVAHGEKVVQE